MAWYSRCPLDHGFPQFVTVTFMDGNYHPVVRRSDMIPAMQHGVGILSYLKYDRWLRKRRRSEPWVMDFARAQGDYLCQVAVTPNLGAFASFTRSTGKTGQFPYPADSGCQADRPYEVEPDKGGLAGYALVELYVATGEKRYLTQALSNASALAKSIQEGDGQHSPWPFRVDFRTGEG